eukprot:s3479_g8.t1
MAPMVLPAQGNVSPGYGADPFIRDQLQQAHMRETQSQAQINLLLQQQANLLSHPPSSIPTPVPQPVPNLPQTTLPEPPSASPQHPQPVPPSASTPPPVIDASDVASQIVAAFKESLQQTVQPSLLVQNTSQGALQDSLSNSLLAQLLPILVRTSLLRLTIGLLSLNPADSPVLPDDHVAMPKTSAHSPVSAAPVEKPPFRDAANFSFAMIRGTNIVGAKYSLAEAMVPRADWTYRDPLHKSELPTYGCFSIGAEIASRELEIPRYVFIDLPDRASKRGKGQQEIPLPLYKGRLAHTALKAGGNDQVNGLTFPRAIRSSAFTQRLDIEGCDPLALPLAALLHQQADNFWLRKLAHGRERQDGQTLDKTNNTKYAAKLVAEYIQNWLPMKATDPSSQHTIIQLQPQVAELKQRLGEPSSDSAAPDASTPPPGPTPPQSTPTQPAPIQRALQANPAAPPPDFEPANLLVAPLSPNTWLATNTPTSVAPRTYNQWFKDLGLSSAQKATVERNITNAEEWWQNQPGSAVDTVQRTAIMMGLPLSILKGNCNDVNLIRVLTIAVTMSG